MQIQKLLINEYGSFKDREFVLDGGMNVIEGDNESGKSTVLSFIRFMLYGMPRKAAGTVTERDRGISWGGGVAGGSMELTVPDKNGETHAYRIERHGQLRGATGHENYAETCKIIDLATGTEVFEGQEPGRALLGVSQETFVSTACIRQLECTSVDGNGVNASIENLLFAANEGINTEKATGKLDDIRKTLLHKNGKGGLLFDLEAKKLILEEKLTRAKEAAEEIVAKESIVAATIALENDLGAKLRECEDALTLYENCTVLRRFDELHARENAVEELEKTISALRDGKGYEGPLPTRETVLEAQQLERRLSENATAVAAAQAELSKAKNGEDGDREYAAYAAKMDELGGKEPLIKEFARLSSRITAAKPLSLLAYVFGGLLLLAGVLGLFFALSTETPILSLPLFVSLASTVSGMMLPILGGSALLFQVLSGAIIAIGIFLIVLGILQTASAADAKKQRTALAETVGFCQVPSNGAFSAHVDACLDARDTCGAYDTAVDQAKAICEQKEFALNARLAECLAKLRTYDVNLDAPTVETVSSALNQTADILSAICAERERLEGDLQNAKALVATMNEGLTGYNERTLRSSVGENDPEKILATADVEKMEMARRYAKEQLASATAKRIAMEKELIALTASSENPAKLYAKLDEITTELAEKRFQYESVVMAIEAIDSASDSLRKSVTPRIREKAGALMNKITDGKYSELGVAQDMSVNVFAGNSTRSIDVLSKGTRDAAYLSLRMALADLVFGENLPPLTLDESLSLLDEKRAVNVLSMLHDYACGGGQCLLFTCHKREGQLLDTIGKFHHIRLS